MKKNQKFALSLLSSMLFISCTSIAENAAKNEKTIELDKNTDVESSSSLSKSDLLAELAINKLGAHGLEDCADEVVGTKGIAKDFSGYKEGSRQLMENLYAGFESETSGDVIIEAYRLIVGEKLPLTEIADRSIQKKLLKRSLVDGKDMDVTAKYMLNSSFKCPAFVRDAKKLLEMKV